MLHQLDIGKQVYRIPQATLVQRLASKVLGQNVLEPPVLLISAAHSLIDDRANLWCVDRSGNYALTGVLWHKEDVLGGVFTFILLKAITLVYQFLVLDLKAIGDVF